MIIWINGPFGVGKTQTAFELHFRLPGSFVSDPEQHGFALFKTLPRELRGDFQDLPMWRQTTFETLRYLDQSHHGVTIVPMTVVNPQYFAETVGQLREAGVDVQHFSLLASKETLLKRLRSRGDSSRSWAAQQVERCMDGLQDPVFATHVQTENLTIAGQAETIAEACGLTLLPAQKNRIAQALRRFSTVLHHIR
ncbi:AAA family ATPase [Deinococcus cellulosilyticus]|uniref:Tunicamycin resistance protein n=1 Tax=Deinococcus cellulosilyticus (strain DSM 18568 / NBRC 106333 / KACC 11606 / 5516J-15) TaxID=1223518 RepID=A0A511N730_DEIC1|nr:AAA family ATPase [Deinococcus cellulosilyticus]GEM48287.1 tunicamycin resistance protein [Deinococcus cellulosilyticus NBRC 106333 = KACC 11606]